MKIKITRHEIETTEPIEHNGRKGVIELGKRITAIVSNGNVAAKISFRVGPFEPLYKETAETAVMQTILQLSRAHTRGRE